MKSVIFFRESYQVVPHDENAPEERTMRVATPAKDAEGAMVPGQFDEHHVKFKAQTAKVGHIEFPFYLEDGVAMPDEDLLIKASYDWYAAMVVEAHLLNIHEQIEGKRRIVTPDEAQREGIILPMKPNLVPS